MKRRILCMVVALVLAFPAFAFGKEDEEEKPDARYMGYKTKVDVKPRNIPVLWMTWLGLTAICVVVMFKNAKRTHLD